MPSTILFNNKLTVEPGGYSRITSGTSIQATQLPSGTVLIIDSGSGAGWGGGSGINGALKQNKDSIYTFSDFTEMRAFIKGGELWDVIDYLWHPSNNTSGVTSVVYVRACTTTPATTTMNFVNGGSLVVKTVDEGLIANGTEYGSANDQSLIFSDKLYAGNSISATINGLTFIQPFVADSNSTMTLFANLLQTPWSASVGISSVATESISYNIDPNSISNSKQAFGITALTTVSSTSEITCGALPASIQNGDIVYVNLPGVTWSGFASAGTNYFYAKVISLSLGTVELFTDSGLSVDVTHSGTPTFSGSYMLAQTQVSMAMVGVPAASNVLTTSGTIAITDGALTFSAATTAVYFTVNSSSPAYVYLWTDSGHTIPIKLNSGTPSTPTLSFNGTTLINLSSPLPEQIQSGLPISATIPGITLSPVTSTYITQIRTATQVAIYQDTAYSEIVSNSGTYTSGGTISISLTNPITSATVVNGGVGSNVNRQIDLVGSVALTIDKLSVTGGTNQPNLSVLDTGNGLVISGYAQKLNVGSSNPAAFSMQFLTGDYKGLDENNNPYDQLSVNSNQVILLQTPDFTRVSDLVTYLNNNSVFTQFFTVESFVDCVLSPTDLINYPSTILFTGGTETYSLDEYAAALNAVVDENFSQILSDRYGADVMSTYNQQLIGFINSSSLWERIMYVGGGYNASAFTGSNSSMAAAAYYNDESVVIVHSGIQVPSGKTTKALNTFYHAAVICGLNAGLSPQVSATYKTTRITGLVHTLSYTQRVNALKGGVLHQKFVKGTGWVVNQAITTVQKNDLLFNPDTQATTSEISIKRIKIQINTDLAQQGTILITGNNINTIGTADILSFVTGYFKGITATRQEDNLVIKAYNYTVKYSNGIWDVKYYFVPNTPINREYFTGFMIDPNISSTQA